MSGAELVGVVAPARRALDDRRRREVALRLTRIVEESPGISASEAVERVRCAVSVQRTFAFSVLVELTHEGSIQRLAWGSRHCLFPPDLEVGDWWQQVAALRDEALCTLYELIRDGSWTLAALCRELQERHRWGASTTRARVQRLQEAGLVTVERPGRRNRPLQIRSLHPVAMEAIDDCILA